MGRWEKRQLQAVEEQEDQLAKQVRVATFNQLTAQLDHDLAIVETKVMESKDTQALEAAKDAKFLRERQANLESVTTDFFCFPVLSHVVNFI